MSNFILFSLFSLSSLSALASPPTQLKPIDGPPSQSIPPEERPRAVRSELARLIAPHPSFGEALAGVGDLDGDGHGDFAITAPGQHYGTLYVYRGTPDSVSLWAQVSGECKAGGFGQAVAGGDLNGDGFDDIVVSAPACGEVLALYGGPDGLSDPEQVLGGAVGLGERLAVHDLDGDGRADLLATEPSAAGDRVIAQLTPGAKKVILQSDTPFAGPITSLGVVSDLNGDGLPEVLAGMPSKSLLAVLYDAATPEAGSELGWLEGLDDDGFGATFAGLGDVDGDGYGDLVVGAPSGLDGAGTLELYRGGAGGVGDYPESGLSRDGVLGYGSALASLDPMPGGALFAVTAWDAETGLGRLQIFRPGGEPLLSQMARAPWDATKRAELGRVAAAGDLDGDGWSELLMARCEVACLEVAVVRTGVDSDADGAVDVQDCAPHNPEISPLQAEISEDGIDQDCNGQDRIPRAGFGASKGGERRAAAGCSVLGGAAPVGLYGLLGLALARRRKVS